MDRPSYYGKNDRPVDPYKPSVWHDWFFRLFFFVIGIFIAFVWIAFQPAADIRKAFNRPMPPHKKYATTLKKAGLTQYGLGRSWVEAAEQALTDSLKIEIPFKGAGYFDKSQATALSYRLTGKEGEVLEIQMTVNSRDSMEIFMDLFRMGRRAKDKPKLVAFGDSGTYKISHQIQSNRQYLLRIQPELFRSGSYELTIEKRPSFSFPVHGKDSRAIKSFFGDRRGGGTRKHKGVDIFAKTGTPALAAVEGRITRVYERGLGGKVVWLRDRKTGANLYYAHLDSQIVRPGERVMPGDVVGLVGKTGNARTTPPHLHFGIYTRGRGAVDPYPFVHRSPEKVKEIQVPNRALGNWFRTRNAKGNLYQTASRKATHILPSLPRHTSLKVISTHSKWCRVETPDGIRGFIPYDFVEPAQSPLPVRPLLTKGLVLESPVVDSPSITVIPPGKEFTGLARYNDFYLVSLNDGKVGWVQENP